jgi:hypothetical protein
MFALAAVSCFSMANDKALVAKATASYTYHGTSYEWACIGHVGPEECKPCFETLKIGRKQIQLANEVYKIGKMPKAEVEGLKTLIVALETCP